MKKPEVRTKRVKKSSKKAGLPPGTLVHVGEKKVDSVRVTYLDYDQKDVEVKQVSTVEECYPFKATPTVTWINIDGLHDVEMMEKLGKERWYSHYELRVARVERAYDGPEGR